MNRAKIVELSEWYEIKTGKRMNVSTFSLPTGYHESLHAQRKTGRFGWWDLNLNQLHARPDLANTEEEVRELLEKWGYEIE